VPRAHPHRGRVDEPDGARNVGAANQPGERSVVASSTAPILSTVVEVGLEHCCTTSSVMQNGADSAKRSHRTTLGFALRQALGSREAGGHGPDLRTANSGLWATHDRRSRHRTCDRHQDDGGGRRSTTGPRLPEWHRDRRRSSRAEPKKPTIDRDTLFRLHEDRPRFSVGFADGRAARETTTSPLGTEMTGQSSSRRSPARAAATMVPLSR